MRWGHQPAVLALKAVRPGHQTHTDLSNTLTTTHRNSDPEPLIPLGSNLPFPCS